MVSRVRAGRAPRAGGRTCGARAAGALENQFPKRAGVAVGRRARAAGRARAPRTPGLPDTGRQDQEQDDARYVGRRRARLVRNA